MKSDLEEKLDRAACHEAAHVVVAYLEAPFVPTTKVWIDPKGQHHRPGCTLGEAFLGNPIARSTVEKVIMYLCAGDVQDQIDNRRESGASRDDEDEQALHLACHAERGDLSKAKILRERLRQQVQALLSEPRHQLAVKSLADVLLERLCLPGNEALEIVRCKLQ